MAITGASSGLGAEMARQLGGAGARVGLTARRADLLEALAAELRDRGATVAVAPADAADRGATAGAIARIAEAIGPIDLLIANAGWGATTRAVGFSAEQVAKVTAVNYLGAAAAIEAVLPSMIARRSGQIAGVSSLAGYRGFPGSGAYCASKAAMTALLESLRGELEPLGVGVTVIHPGFVRTPMTDARGGPQPWKLEVGPAARIMLAGIARRRRRVDFPWPAAATLGAARLMPAWLFDRLARRFW